MDNHSPSEPSSSPWADRRLSQTVHNDGSKTQQSPPGAGSKLTRLPSSPVSRIESADSFHVTINDAEQNLYSTPDRENQFQKTQSYSGSAGGGGNRSNFMKKPIKRLKHPADQSMLRPLIGTLIFVILALATCIPFITVVLLVVPVAYTIRRLASYRRCACLGCPNLLSSMDRFWRYETDSHHSVSQCLLQLDGELQVTRIRELLLARVVSAENKRGTKLFSRFTQRVIPVMCGYQWRTDDDFNIDNHIVKVAESFKTKADVINYVSKLVCSGLRHDRPLWDLHVLELGTEHPDTLLLFRVHACVSDGVNLTEMLRKALADSHGNSPETPIPPKNRFGRRAFAFNTIRALIVGPLVVIRQILCGSDDFNLFRERKVSGRKRVAWSDAILLPPVYRVKLVTRCSLNDVALSAVVGSLRHYLQTSGVDNPKSLHANLAVDFRGCESPRGGVGPMGNRFSLTNVRLPTHTEGAIPRLWDTKKRMDELKLSADHVVMYGLTKAAVTAFPQAMSQSFLSSFFGESSCTISNLAISEELLSFGGKPIKMVLFWMSPGDEVPFSISLMTYGGTIRICVLADEGVVPDAHIITDNFKHQIDKLISLLAHRRIPGEYRRRNLDEDEDEDDEIDPLEEEIRTPSSASSRKNHPLSASCLQRPGSSRSSSVMRPLSTETPNDSNKTPEGAVSSHGGSDPDCSVARVGAVAGGGSSSDRQRTSGSGCSMECVSFSQELSNSDADLAFDISPSVERRTSFGHVV